MNNLSQLLKKVKTKSERPRKSIHTTLSLESFKIMDLYKEVYELDNYSQVIELALFLYDAEKKRKKRLNKFY